MKFFLKKLKENRGLSAQAGMTYIELIVVLSIFSVLTAVVIFNYGDFQARVDMKNLAADIALKIVEAQKSSLSGTLPASSTGAAWKPSYGVYLSLASPKQFIYFVDLNNAGGYGAGAELLDTIAITKNNSMSAIDRCTGVTCTSVSPLAILFKRPDSGAIFQDSSGVALPNNFEYIRITTTSPKGVTAFIKVYPSGRIQVN